MATEREKSTVRGKADTEEPIAEAAVAETTAPPGPAGPAAQPEGVMAAGSEEEGGLVAEEEFPWEKVLKWALTIVGVMIILYLIFRRRD